MFIRTFALALVFLTGHSLASCMIEETTCSRTVAASETGEASLTGTTGFSLQDRIGLCLSNGDFIKDESTVFVDYTIYCGEGASCKDLDNNHLAMLHPGNSIEAANCIKIEDFVNDTMIEGSYEFTAQSNYGGDLQVVLGVKRPANVSFEYDVSFSVLPVTDDGAALVNAPSGLLVAALAALGVAAAY